MLGHDRFGSGPLAVVVLNDWLCDTSTWEGARAYLDRERFTWLFTDLRGYGRSRLQPGRHDLAEAAGDVLALADAIGCPRVAIVGHSMSTLVALRVAQLQPRRFERLVLIAPPPPLGFGADQDAIDATARQVRDPVLRRSMLDQRFAIDFAPGWAAFKAERWTATADADAAADYAAMFFRDALPVDGPVVSIPVLAIAGELDAPPMRPDAVAASLEPWCPRLRVEALAGVGHYPMQELTPRTVTLVERFLSGT